MPETKDLTAPKLVRVKQIDRDLIASGNEMLAAKFGKRPRGYTDSAIVRYCIRKVLASKEIIRKHGNGIE